MSLNAGLRGPMSIIPIANRDELYNVIKKFIFFIESKKIKDRDLISDRLFKRYVDYEQAQKINNIFLAMTDLFLLNFSKKEEIIFLKFTTSFVRLLEQMKFLFSQGEDKGIIKIIISDPPYEIEDKYKSNNFYDSLSQHDKPYWMRDI